MGKEKLRQLLEGKSFTLVDVGASGGVHARWQYLSGLLKTVGFEPDKQEFEKLQKTDMALWFNVALSSKKETRTLNITRSQTNTSFLEPNDELLSSLQWSMHEPIDDHEIVKKVPVECDTLDSLLSGSKPDFIKVDTQGSELEILQGGGRTLREDILIAEIEVEFAEIYKGQPLFADVDQFMRNAGFHLHDLGNFLYVKPHGFSDIGGAKGRIISADALYFKTFDPAYYSLFEMGERKVFAAVAGYTAYGYPDLGMEALRFFINTGKAPTRAAKIAEELGKMKPCRLPGLSSLAKKFGRLWLKFRDPGHSLWDVPLGN